MYSLQLVGYSKINLITFETNFCKVKTNKTKYFTVSKLKYTIFSFYQVELSCTSQLTGTLLNQIVLLIRIPYLVFYCKILLWMFILLHVLQWLICKISKGLWVWYQMKN